MLDDSDEDLPQLADGQRLGHVLDGEGARVAATLGRLALRHHVEVGVIDEPQLSPGGLSLEGGRAGHDPESLGDAHHLGPGADVRVGRAAGAIEPDEVIGHTVRTIRPPAGHAATVLSLGLAIFLLSRFPGRRPFGLQSTVTLKVGFFSDMMAIVVSMRRFFAWPTRSAPHAPKDTRS